MNSDTMTKTPATIQDRIAALVRYIDDPGWRPERVHGHQNMGDWSSFRRCVPLAVLDELDPFPQVFADATLDDAGVSSHAALTLWHDLPHYASLKKISRVPPRWRRIAGEPHMLTRSGAIMHNGTLRHVITEAVVMHQGSGWVSPPVICPSVVGGVCEEAAPAAAAMCGAAFSYRYSATAEIESGNGTSVAIPLTLEGLRAVLRDRDRPEGGDRRPALLHLVAEHARRSRNSDDAGHVREHLRGKMLCHWRGWDVVLRPSIYDTERLRRA